VKGWLPVGGGHEPPLYYFFFKKKIMIIFKFFLFIFFYCDRHISIFYWVWRGKLTESVNLVNEKWVQEVIHNYSLPQRPFTESDL
jgi:hypothetical protein